MLRDILTSAVHRLTIVGCDTPRLDAEVLLAHVLGQERVWLYTHPQVSLAEEQINNFEMLLRRREQREPVAYLTGCKEFFGLEFEVNPHVLIPRPETELLVETAIKLSTNEGQGRSIPYGILRRSAISIADVGAGSGCIAVALAKYLPAASIIAIDLSLPALSLAEQNARRHGVAERITFLPGDLLQPLIEPVDLIVSNPPYVSRPELATVAPEVGWYEPRLALDGGNDGLEIVKRLLAEVVSKLKPGGNLLIEIGFSQGRAVSQIAQKYFPEANIWIEQDLAGLDRLLVAQLGLAKDFGLC